MTPSRSQLTLKVRLPGLRGKTVAFEDDQGASWKHRTVGDIGTGTPGERDYACTKAKLKNLDCGGYRLPTEPEWEARKLLEPRGRHTVALT